MDPHIAHHEKTPLAGDVDYDRFGGGYATHRQTDPRIAAFVHAALGSARTVLNVGAGAGSYEPLDRHVLAVEPSRAMRLQRALHIVPAIKATAEELPFDDNSIDASMALITVHQWSNVEQGLRELRRVTRGAVVVMTFDIDVLDRFWLADYVPELISVERRRFPTIASIQGFLGENSRVQAVPVPRDCTDGFAEAYYARPERFLDPAVRLAQSAWSFVEPTVVERAIDRLGRDLESGAWNSRYSAWRTLPQYEGSLRLIISEI